MTPSPGGLAEWTAVAIPVGGFAAPIADVSWSPSSRELLAWTGQPDGLQEWQIASLVTPDGVVEATYPGVDKAVWLDDQRFLLYTYQRTHTGVGQVVNDPDTGLPVASVAIASADSAPQPIDGIDSNDVLGNGQGALALTIPHWRGERLSHRFHVWMPTGVSADHDGYPVNWSAQGDKLAVLHVTKNGPGLAGWPEIVSWPGLETIWADRNIRISNDVGLELAFDPAGERLAFVDAHAVHVVGLDSGVSTIWKSGQPWGSLAWDAQSRLVVADFASQHAAAYDAGGAALVDYSTASRLVFATPDGETVLLYLDRTSPPPVLGIVHAGMETTLELPMQTQGSPQISPDGRYVALISAIDVRPAVLVHTL